jgi:hypothetical protein
LTAAFQSYAQLSGINEHFIRIVSKASWLKLLMTEEFGAEIPLDYIHFWQLPLTLLNAE